MRRYVLIPLLVTTLLLFTGSCRPAATPPSLPESATATSPASSQGAFELSSEAFQADQPIPVRYACHGDNLSPPLAWSTPPGGTQSLVLVMDDPDAVAVTGFVWDHWLLFNIPAESGSLPEGIPAEAELPDGSRHGKNSSGRPGYAGPCPPSGQTHQYVFSLYALDTSLSLEPQASKEEILQALAGHILAQAQLAGLYTSP